jgi:hypothetical protein
VWIIFLTPSLSSFNWITSIGAPMGSHPDSIQSFTSSIIQ